MTADITLSIGSISNFHLSLICMTQNMYNNLLLFIITFYKIIKKQKKIKKTNHLSGPNKLFFFKNYYSEHLKNPQLYVLFLQLINKIDLYRSSQLL